MSDQKMKLLAEDVLSMSQAAREIPGRPHVSTVWRWANRGIKGERLATVSIGGRIFTSRQAVTRFLESTQSPAA